MRIRLFFSLLLALSLAASSFATERVLARLAVVTYRTIAYSDSSLTDRVFDLAVGDKLVVLSNSSNAARVLQTNGDELFVPMRDIEITERVTLTKAMQKVSYFERMRNQNPEAGSYYDQQAGPWVALVARHHANRKEAAELPDVQGENVGTSSLPRLTIDNDTGYTLRVYLVGPQTVSRLVRPGQSLSEYFAAGTYRTVVEATSGRVVPLRSTWRLQRGYLHTIKLYISRTRS